MTRKEAAMRIGFIFARTSWLAVAVFAAVSMMNPKVAPAAQKVISVTNASHNIEDFRRYAELAARLKPYGEVQITVSALADKSWYEIPAGGSPWHEFICYKVAPWKYFPHPEDCAFYSGGPRGGEPASARGQT